LYSYKLYLCIAYKLHDTQKTLKRNFQDYPLLLASNNSISKKNELCPAPAMLNTLPAEATKVTTLIEPPVVPVNKSPSPLLIYRQRNPSTKHIGLFNDW
jgi:hypothetical protein